MLIHLLKNEHLKDKMQLFDNIKGLQHAVSAAKHRQMKLGFVPTMGALHKGHLSLVELARKENDLVVVSIFVNPTQFNNADDLKNYPRTLDADLEILKELNPHLVFAPTVVEIYPAQGITVPAVKLGLLERTMEGKHRPGHFNGVVQVVARLFDIVHPDRAYFGSKDFQQLAVIREMTRQLNLPIDIRSGETIRDADGLAMSSRNILLSRQEREDAAGVAQRIVQCLQVLGARRGCQLESGSQSPLRTAACLHQGHRQWHWHDPAASQAGVRAVFPGRHVGQATRQWIGHGHRQGNHASSSRHGGGQ